MINLIQADTRLRRCLVFGALEALYRKGHCEQAASPLDLAEELLGLGDLFEGLRAEDLAPHAAAWQDAR